MENEFQTTDRINTFDWDKETPEEAFFGEEKEVMVEDEPEVKVPKVDGKEQEKEVKSTEEEQEEEQKNEEDFSFGTTPAKEKVETPDEDEEEGDITQEEKPQAVSSLSTLNFLKEKGLVNFELEEGQELTEEDAEVLLEDSYESSVEKRIEELFETMPKEVKQFNQFVIKGGDPKDYLKTLQSSENSTLSKELDLTKEENQEKALREIMKSEGEDQESIDSYLEYLKDSGKLEKISEKKFEAWKVAKEKEEEKLVQAQAEKQRAAKEATRKYKSDLTNYLGSTEEIKNLKVTAKDKRELPGYMSEKNIKLENGQYITQMQKDLYDAMKDGDNSILLAKVLKSGFSFDDVIESLNTKVTKEAKKVVREGKNGPKKSVGGSKSRKGLAEYF